MDFDLRENHLDLDFEDVITIYLKNGWGKQKSDYSTANLMEAFANTAFVATAYQKKRLAGWARAMSDGVTNTWIMEIVIDPDFQRKGLGTKMVDLIKRKYSRTALWAETYLKTKAFAEKCGLTTRDIMVVVSKGMENRSS
jgi:GNAT superfamily N-acetyltransferase